MERIVSKFFINFLTEIKEEQNLEKNSLLCLESFIKPQLPKPNDYMLCLKLRQKIYAFFFLKKSKRLQKTLY